MYSESQKSNPESALPEEFFTKLVHYSISGPKTTTVDHGAMQLHSHQTIPQEGSRHSDSQDAAPSQRLWEKLEDSSPSDSELKPHSDQPIPQEGDHLPNPPEFIHANRLKGESNNPTALDQDMSECSEYKKHSIHPIPKENDHLQDSPKFIHVPFQRLREKLKDSAAPDQDAIPGFECKRDSIHPIPKEGNHYHPDSPEFIFAPFQRLKEKPKASTAPDQDIIPGYECKQHSIHPIPNKGGHHRPGSPEFIHAPFQRLREQLKESIIPDHDNISGLSALKEIEETKQPVGQKMEAGRSVQRKRVRGGATPLTLPPNQRPDEGERTAPSPPLLQTPPQQNNAAANAMSINCTSCTINYNYVPPARYGGLLICEIAIVLAFAFFTYMFRKT